VTVKYTQKCFSHFLLIGGRESKSNGKTQNAYDQDGEQSVLT